MLKLNYFVSQVFDLQKKLKNSEQKYKEILNDYEVMKNYVIKKQKMTEGVQSISEMNVSIVSYDYSHKLITLVVIINGVIKTITKSSYV